MDATKTRFVLFASALLAAICLDAAEDVLKETQSIPLPHVSGRIDHMAFDMAGKRLFVCALGNNTVEVFDLSEGKHIRSITGLSEPQDALFLSDTNRLIVSNGGDGTCRSFDGKTYKFLAMLDLQKDADNLRFDPAEKRIYIGYGDGAIGMVDAEFRHGSNIPLPGHPESFQTGGKPRRMFVNVPAARQIAVIDLEKQIAVDTWKLHGAEGNYPMALDEKNHLLLVGCRRPAKLLGMDSQSGHVLFELPIDADPDDIFVDAQFHRAYVSCGAGFIDVFEKSAGAIYRLIARIPTEAGARTSLFVPETQQLFLAVPSRGGREAEIRVYSIQQTELTGGRQPAAVKVQPDPAEQ